MAALDLPELRTGSVWAREVPAMSINGWNPEFVEAMHRQWQADPASVDARWDLFFKGFDLGLERSVAPTGTGSGDAPAAGAVAPTAPASTREAAITDIAHTKQGKVDSLIYHYRDIGHLASSLDPLGTVRPFPEQLTLESFDLTDADLEERFDPGILPLENPARLGDIIELLEDTYCRNVGVEYMHIQDREKRRWLQRRMETTRNRPTFSNDAKLHLLRQLAKADGFETFLQQGYVGKKRFGLEGGECLIAVLDQFIELSPANGVEELALGMAHRGRLNVLVNILRKSYAQVFTEFDEAWTEDFLSGGGDVKYHQGYSSDCTTTSGHSVHLTLAANPSHLEFIGSVVLGRARAKQRLRGDTARERVIPVVIHGDAAMPGQGIVAECFNMMRLDGYTVGGTLHVVINNQVGFTTNPRDGFSGRYCTDLAKMVDAPIFHVNGDDPEACAWVARLALEYRQAFKNDVVVDLWCYRRHGHNETDEPSYTQPLLYSRIRKQKAVLQRYAEQLVSEHAVTREQVDAISIEVSTAMKEAQDTAKAQPVDPAVDPFAARWAGLQGKYSFDPVHTGVDRQHLIEIARELARVPEGFTTHKTIEKLLKSRGGAVERDEPIDWALGEMLAYGSLLLEGHPIRLTGQDVERGTFSHRHAVVFDQVTGHGYTALNQLGPGQAGFSIHNSPLTEAACIGFEYGYSLTDPRMLILWEGQFGDFVNGAQVLIDQFLASGEIKWQRYSGLTLLLPHGYEGQGPEHSSARLERFLQLCSNENMQVVYPTSSAQMFHLLRRQMKVDFRKPLIVMSPKSMLRLPAATSAVRELIDGRFEMVIDDQNVAQAGTPTSVKPAAIRQIILCSGKIYHELATARLTAGRTDLAIIRIEQLYPFPEERLREVLAAYSSKPEIVWVQEEPRNMGAWRYMQAMLRERLELDVLGISRHANASPAAGSSKMHAQEQEKIMIEAIGLGATKVK